MVRPKFGLTAKLTFVLAIGVLLVEGVLTMGWLARERTVLDQKVQQDERALGAALAIALSEIASRDGVDRAKAVVQQIDREAKVPLSLSWEEGAPAVDASRDASGWTQSTWNRQSVALSRVPIPETGAALVVGDPLADEVAYLSQSRNNALYALAATVLVCVLIAAIAGYFLVSRPVSALVHHARSVAAGRLDTRSRIRGGGELAALSKELNAMTAALAAAQREVEEQTRRRLSAVDQLRHADRLRTVGTLASGLAHELGTPLHCVAGYAQLIEERPDIDAEARESAGVIRQQAARMSAIIRQLLGFARAQPAPAEGGADPAEVFHSVLGMLKPPLKKAGSSVEHDLGDLPEVAIDAAGLSQVLTNILINAVHATGANASKDPIRVTSAVWEDVVMLRVEDSGVGMEQEVLKRVFDPFFTTKDVGEGTGLGLSVAYGIVAEAGGRIELESEPAAGTRVSLYLPRFPGAPLLEAAV